MAHTCSVAAKWTAGSTLACIIMIVIFEAGHSNDLSLLALGASLVILLATPFCAGIQYRSWRVGLASGLMCLISIPITFFLWQLFYIVVGGGA